MSEGLFVSRSTTGCAKNGCIPCFYKIFPDGNFPILQKHSKKRKFEQLEQQKLVPNQRPENCLRAKNPYYAGFYTASQHVLTVGDGDLSFSLSLAKEFRKQSREHPSLIATTYENRDSLLRTYPDIEKRLETLANMDIEVHNGVDATSLERYDFLAEKRFDRILWNFPCIRIEKGLDGQVSELDQNKNLIRTFFRSALSYLKEGGEIHLTHKTVEPFSWWGIETLAEEAGFRCVLKIAFDKYNYPSYVNRKALDKKSFPCNDARVFVFLHSERPSSEDSDVIGRYSPLILPIADVIEELQEIGCTLLQDTLKESKKR